MDKETYFFFIKHLIFVVMSIFLLVFISIQEKKKIIKFIPILFLVSIIFLLLVPFFGTEIKGSKRWIELFFLPRFQPVEFAKPLFIIFVAKIIILNDKMNIYNRHLLSLSVLSLIIILLIGQPDLGQTFLFLLSWLTMVFVSGFNMFVMFVIAFFALAIIALLIFIFPSKFGYVFVRLKTFLNPQSGDNFQSQKALDAIKQGGLTGQGMGEGILKEKVPEAHTDYIIAVVSEEFGALFVLFIIMLFLFTAYRVLEKVFATNNEFLKLSLIGLITIIIVQTFIHIGVNTRLFPTTGMTLPFLSYGGSSLIGSSIAAGIILNFTRKDSIRH